MTWKRRSELERLGHPDVLDVLIIGGGVVGAGTALDAAARGMKVALIDRSDFGAGTSSRSTKLLHGGIRYMPQFRFGLVREGLLEQKVLQRTADYLYEPLEFILPLYRQRGFGDVPPGLRSPKVIPLALRAGLILYDLLGARRDGRHYRVTAEEVHRMAPLLTTEGLRGGFVYTDALTDDARLGLAVARTAVERFGAVAVNWTEALSVHHEGGRYRVHLHDRLGDGHLEVHARTVVAATGAFSPPAPDGTHGMMGIVRSKGAHISVPAASVGLTDRALALPETEDERVLYIVPWQGAALVGTTDTSYDERVDHPRATPEDVDYLLRHVREYLPGATVEPISAWAGLRALAAAKGADTSRASRAPKIRESSPGYFQVAGGKLTGYRIIAADVVDQVANHLAVKAKSPTKHLPLTGTGATEQEIAAEVVAAGFEPTYARLLYHRYGAHSRDILRLVAERPELAEPLGDGQATLAEAVYGAHHECVATPSDFLERRTRLVWHTVDHGRKAAPAVAEALAEALGWSDDQTRSRLDLFDEELAAEGL